MTPAVYHFRNLNPNNIYRPQTKLREGNVFTGVCDSVHRGVVPAPGGGGSAPGGCLLGGECLVPGGSAPAGCLLQGVPALGGLLLGGCLLPGGTCSGGCLVETLPEGYCCGRYASYWNAFLY